MRKLLVALATLVVIAALTPVAIIASTAPDAPPAMESMAEPFRHVNFENVPAPQQFAARDGVGLRYYAYRARPDQVAVLIHGSVGPGTSMHALAEALRSAGVTTYVLDIRGHGASGLRGDIGYIGQIDDDLADFVAQLGPVGAGETRTLVGFSAGAGFTIRFAGGRYGLLFDRYVFLAPILPGAPTLRPNAGGWTNVSVPRVVTIAGLDRLGVHWFDGLPVISYAASGADSQGTASYSYRLAANFGASREYEGFLRNIRRPSAVLVGGADEQVVAHKYAPLFQLLDLNIPVTIVPNMKHADMIARPEALKAVVQAIARQQ